MKQREYIAYYKDGTSKQLRATDIEGCVIKACEDRTHLEDMYPTRIVDTESGRVYEDIKMVWNVV